MNFSYPNLVCGLLAAIFSLLSVSTFAQPIPDPLFFRLDDALWQWTETDGFEEVITLPPNILSSSLSSTQTHFVYERYTERVLEECFDAEGNGLGCAGPNKFPTDIFAINLRTGETIIIAGATDPTMPESGRSRPVWSPDGTRLAWTEGYDYASLHIYDFVLNETSRIVEEIVTRATLGVSATVEITTWLDAGIVFQREIVDADTNTIREGFLVYDPVDGSLKIDAPPLKSSTGHYFASYDNTDVIFTDKEYLNLQTGEILPTPNGILARYAYGSPDTSLRLYPPILGEDGIYRYKIYSTDGEMVIEIENAFSFSFLPTGTAFAHKNADILSVWRPESDGGPFEIELPEGSRMIGWGVRQRYLFEPGGEAFIVRSRCEASMLPFRMRRGDMGYVLGDTPNNVRAVPSISGEIVGQVAPGVPFRVINGPVCSDGLAWWPLAHPDGWTAEGAGNEYWLHPGCPEYGCGDSG